jgi:hypothetical protein
MRPYFYILRDLLKAPAFMALAGRAPQVLMVFFSKRWLKKLKRPSPRGDSFVCLNNGKLVFTYVEAKKVYGLSAKVFLRAIDQLVRYGFLDISHSGGGLEGDYSMYGVSERWRDYGKPTFVSKARPKGRPWQTKSTALKGGAATAQRGRGCEGGTSPTGRGLPPNTTSANDSKRTCSIDHHVGSRVRLRQSKSKPISSVKNNELKQDTEKRRVKIRRVSLRRHKVEAMRTHNRHSPRKKRGDAIAPSLSTTRSHP